MQSAEEQQVFDDDNSSKIYLGKRVNRNHVKEVI